MFTHLAVYFTHIIENLGYWGAGFLMGLESMVAPVPSELVMPFVGFLVADGKFTWTFAILATSLGSIVGSLVSYALGYWGGRPIVMKVGRYLLLNEHDLEWTENWFARNGSWTILVSRFNPVVRHLISIPAGLGKMKLLPFCLYTLIGATLWNTFLLVCGFKLKQNWETVEQYSKQIDRVMIVVVAIAAVWFVKTHLARYRRQNGKASSGAKK